MSATNPDVRESLGKALNSAYCDRVALVDELAEAWDNSEYRAILDAAIGEPCNDLSWNVLADFAAEIGLWRVYEFHRKQETRLYVNQQQPEEFVDMSLPRMIRKDLFGCPLWKIEWCLQITSKTRVIFNGRPQIMVACHNCARIIGVDIHSPLGVADKDVAAYLESGTTGHLAPLNWRFDSRDSTWYPIVDRTPFTVASDLSLGQTPWRLGRLA